MTLVLLAQTDYKYYDQGLVELLAYPLHDHEISESITSPDASYHDCSICGTPQLV